MIAVPKDRRIWLYPDLDNIESDLVATEDLIYLPELKDYMVSMMFERDAVGLSAPQVGIFKQFFVMRSTSGEVVEMINPEIVRMTGKELLGEEACLSVPPGGNRCLVPRMQKVVCEYWRIGSPKFMLTASWENQDAVVIQQEIDHLTGTFFFDRVGNAVRQKVLEEFNRWKEVQINARTKPSSSQSVAAYRL